MCGSLGLKVNLCEGIDVVCVWGGRGEGYEVSRNTDMSKGRVRQGNKD